MDVWLHALLTSALDGNEWSASRSGRLSRRKNPRYPLDRRLGEAQSQSGGGSEEKKKSLSRKWKPGLPALILVTTLTELPREYFFRNEVPECTVEGFSSMLQSSITSHI
jgi:hypothetical protein